jgi:hypothetical protein
MAVVYTWTGEMHGYRAIGNFNTVDPGKRKYAVTQHTTACYIMQVIDITLAEQASTNITSLRMVQQKYYGPKYKLVILLLQTKA